MKGFIAARNHMAAKMGICDFFAFRLAILASVKESSLLPSSASRNRREVAKMSTSGTFPMRGLGGEALVAHNMRLLRKAARLSQEDLAQRMTRLGHRFHQTQIAKIERGERALRYDEVLALAKALGVPPVPFMTEALGEGAPEFELQEAEFRLQAAAQEWQAAHDHEQAARKRLDEVQREYDEIAERLGVSTGFVFYPAPGSPDDPLRPDAEESNDA